MKYYATPDGFKALKQELEHLLYGERPKLVETVRWAASNGDRSENADYIYGKKRLREIDRRVRYLTKRIENTHVVDPKLQQALTQVFFGATVEYIENNQITRRVKIVGIDEADMAQNKISYTAPVAKALLKAHVGDQVVLRTPDKELVLEVLSICYN